MKWCWSSDIESNDVERSSPEQLPQFMACAFVFNRWIFAPPFWDNDWCVLGPDWHYFHLARAEVLASLVKRFLDVPMVFIFSHESNRNWTSTELGICHNIFGSAEQIPRIGKLEDRVAMEAKTFAGTLALWRGVLRCKWLKRPLGRF